MIRSRSIPTVLSRITGDGIHAVLLIDSDGELLGSYGNPPPQTHNKNSQDDNNVSVSQTSAPWPLDASSIGALISEVAGDYSRMGEELLLLDPQYDSSQQRQSSGEGSDVQKDQSSDGQQQQQQQNQSSRSSSGGDDESSSANMQQGGSADGGKSGKKDTNLKSLIIEMDYGVVGVASVGPDFYVIALADSSVQHGALVGRLRTLGSHVNESLSQLD